MERMSRRERTFRLRRDTDREIPEHAVHAGYRRQSRRDQPNVQLWNALPSRSDQFRLAPQIQGSPLE